MATDRLVEVSYHDQCLQRLGAALSRERIALSLSDVATDEYEVQHLYVEAIARAIDVLERKRALLLAPPHLVFPVASYPHGTYEYGDRLGAAKTEVNDEQI